MTDTGTSQSFLFTFRSNGEAQGEALVEVTAEELADYDPSTASDAFKSAWFGTEVALFGVMEKLGFAAFDVQGVRGALHSHRQADRRLHATLEQLRSVGFNKLAAAS